MPAFKLVLAAVILSTALWGADQELSEAQVQAIVQKFAENETKFTLARENYTYRQTARVQELDESGNVRGRWEMVSDIVFPDGKRTEKVVYAPVSTLRNLILTPEDEKDIRDVQPFVMTTSELPAYWIRYLGKQNADEIPCYVFAVKPKKMEEGKRYFQGMVWVDDRDIMIVKSYGRATGLQPKRGEKQQFPKFETYREQIDGRFWFPTYTRADDVLYFESGPQRMRLIVRYEDYKRFKSESVIKYGEEVESKEPQKP